MLESSISPHCCLFFQAEDGIRDPCVTGVQTCALPICLRVHLEMGRQKRSRMYDLEMDPETPSFLAPGRRRVGIRERLDARGAALVPLDEGQVRAAVQTLRAQGVQAIAVCYLFSFVNPAHERRTRELCAEIAPEISVSLSSEVDPTFREYERLCVTAFDAYLGPAVKRHLAGLAARLRRLGIRAVPLTMRRG